MKANKDLPSDVQRWIQDIREQEAASTIASLIGQRQDILNIGPSWGRDYYYLSELGKNVINVDIALRSHLGSLALCDVTRGLPFKTSSFEVVLLPEVLEHLIEDAAALVEARRVLRDDGLLVVNVPFYDDQAEFRVRIHSARSIRRLLRSTGYEVVAFIERGGLITWPRLIHTLRRICHPIMKTERFNQLVIRFDRFMAFHVKWILRRPHNYGCYIAAHKAQALDTRQLNVDEFQH